MAYVITVACTKCMSCVPVCPVECIHPAEEEPGLDAAAHLNIDPDECTSCGVCAGECPAEAIFEESELPDDKKQFIEENAAYFKT